MIENNKLLSIKSFGEREKKREREMRLYGEDGEEGEGDREERSGLYNTKKKRKEMNGSKASY